MEQQILTASMAEIVPKRKDSVCYKMVVIKTVASNVSIKIILSRRHRKRPA
jgi:hypothetical protein